MLSYILIAAGLSMIASLSGVVFFSQFEKIKEHIHALISVSVGAFLAVAFIGLIPRTLDLAPASGPFYILGGFLGFIIISYLVSAYHHHHGQEECPQCDPQKQRTGYLVLVGDLAHNFVDGVVIASAFLVSPAAGVGATVGVLLHEVPQEIAEFFVLIRAGYTRTRALVWNFIVSSSVAWGAIIGYFLATNIEGAVGPLVGIAAGNLLYIGAADLLPDLFLDEDIHQPALSFIKQFALLLVGVALIITLLQVGGHTHTHEPKDKDPHDHESSNIGETSHLFRSPFV